MLSAIGYEVGSVLATHDGHLDVFELLTLVLLVVVIILLVRR